MQITTNHHVRPLLAAHELPAGVQEEYFDYIPADSEDGPQFFQYRGWWYDTNEFTRSEGDLKISGWDGIQADSVWSGIAVRLSDNEGHYMEDEVVVASLYWG